MKDSQQDRRDTDDAGKYIKVNNERFSTKSFSGLRGT